MDIPPQQRAAHAASLRAGLAAVGRSFDAIKPAMQEAGWDSGFGISVRFTSFPDVQLAVDSLDQKSQGIELLSVREVGDNETIASVWIPEGKLHVFEQKIAAYLEERHDANGKPRDNRKLIDAIREIRTAVIDDLWVDERELPSDDQVSLFEAWLSTPRQEQVGQRRRRPRVAVDPPDVRVARFRAIAARSDIRVSDSELHFPERTVIQLQCTLAQLRASAHLLGQLAELRRAPESPEFFMQLPPNEQREWTEELLGRTQFQPRVDEVPFVCVIDTGCNHAHPLLAPALHPDDVHTVNPAWEAADEHGHGTQQAGLVLWGDLDVALADDAPVVIPHRLESVKLLPRDGANNSEHFGPLTAQAVSLPEIAFPLRRRVFSMAVSSTETTLRGRATAWSAEVDALSSDWAGGGEAPRLMILCAGNVVDQRPGSYAALNSTTSVEDPSQAWNALTVGALTYKTEILGEGTGAYSAVAAEGGISPHSSTSRTWEHQTPFKPDVVFEGGNQGDDGTLVSSFDSLSLLTTHLVPTDRHFATSYGTSASTALASRFAARLVAKYPAFWPETVRALMVHSARWTPELIAQYPGDTPEAVVNRLRHCGWGEPDLDLALYSGADALTLVAQDSLQPYERRPRERDDAGEVRGGNIVTRDMRLHTLPWPREALQELLAMDIELRVTLSYFIEPNPGERGQSNRFAYASHGLRFAVQNARETQAEFMRRINRFAADADAGIAPPPNGRDPGWMLGHRRRFRGSLHHDRLTCSAADLATREHIAVFPVGGWWKTREAQERFDRTARYSLIISIHAPELPNEVDLYAQVQQAIPIEVVVPV